MKCKNHLKTLFSLIAILMMTLATFSNYSFAEEEYSFKVHNNTENTIKSILVSEDGKEWGHFDIGRGIDSGQTVELVWDKSTHSENCVQYFKAVFDDGSESDATKFDFCEKGLVLEF